MLKSIKTRSIVLTTIVVMALIILSLTINASPAPETGQARPVLQQAEAQIVNVQLAPEANFQLVLQQLNTLREQGAISDIKISNGIIQVTLHGDLSTLTAIPGVTGTKILRMSESSADGIAQRLPEANQQTYQLTFNSAYLTAVRKVTLLKYFQELQTEGFITQVAPEFTDNGLTLTVPRNTKFEFETLPGVIEVNILNSDITNSLARENNLTANQLQEKAALPATPTSTPSPQETPVGGYGAVSGQVLDEVTELPLAGIQACGVTSLYFLPIEDLCTTTDQSGGYTISNLYAGSGYVFFRDNSGTYQLEVHNNQSDFFQLQPIQIVNGETTTNVNGLLSQTGGRISGIVTNEDDDTPLADVLVEIYISLDGSSYSYVDQVVTDANGYYQTIRLPQGRYHVLYCDCPEISGHNDTYLIEYYNDASSLETAEAVVIDNSDVTNIDAMLTEGGHISGFVTDDSGNPLEGMGVEAMSYFDDGAFYIIKWAQTDANGYYSINGLMTGDYQLKYQDMSGFYFQEFYNNVTDLDNATLVAATVRQTVGNINMALTKGGVITGIVTDMTGNPLQGIGVETTKLEGSPGDVVVDWTITNEQGEYIANGLAEGDYAICVNRSSAWTNTPYLSECYNDAETASQANPIAVTLGQTVSDINVALLEGGVVAGQISMDDDSAIPQTDVNIYQQQNTSWTLFKTIHANEDGSYQINGLPTGVYRVHFFGFLNYSIPIAQEYYNNVPILSQATDIQAVQGQTVTNIDAVFENITGSINGYVTNQQNEPLVGFSVSAYTSHEDGYYIWAASTEVDANGYYELNGLPPGIYWLQFQSYNSGYLKEYYDNASSIEEATPIEVLERQTTSDVNAVLTQGGIVEGTVWAEDNNTPLRSVTVCISAVERQTNKPDTTKTNGMSVMTTPTPTPTPSSEPSLPPGFLSECDSTDSMGKYQIRGIPDWEYTISFRLWNGFDGGTYLPEYYNDKKLLEEADIITFVNNPHLTNINATLSLGGSISGIVTAQDTQAPLAYIWVCANPVGNTNFWGSTCDQTTTEGTYTIVGLDTEDYTLHFSSQESGYLSEYYDNKPSIDVATSVSVVAGQDTANINASLIPGGTISGQVTDTDDNLLPNIGIEVYRSDGNGGWLWQQWEMTDFNGHYEASGLGTGTYRVGFLSTTDEFLTEYYDDALTLETATDISVTQGTVTNNINAVLNKTGQIDGAVHAENGDPIDNIEVLAYHQENGEWLPVGSGYSDQNGNYTINGLNTGTYRLYFRDPSAFWYYDPLNVTYASEFYEDVLDINSATDIQIVSGQTTPNINAVLSEGGHITGQVTNLAQIPLSNISVEVYKQEGNDWVWFAWANTDMLGNYNVDGLNAGTYRLGFYDWSNTYTYEYFNDAVDVISATDVSVTLGQTTSDINVSLADAVNPVIRILTGSGRVEYDTRTGEALVMQPQDNPTDIIVEKDNVCANGHLFEPHVVFVMNGNPYFMSEQPVGSGTYRGTVPAADLVDGVELRLSIDCDGLPEESRVGEFHFYLYDPSGQVTDAFTKEPIAGANVKLYNVPGWRAKTGASDTADNTCQSNYSKAVSDSWNQIAPTNLGVLVDPLQSGIDPAFNPLATDSEGYYGWDVGAGCWYVVVEAEGYEPLTSPMVGTPPGVTDLNLALIPSQGVYKIYLPLLIR